MPNALCDPDVAGGCVVASCATDVVGVVGVGVGATLAFVVAVVAGLASVVVGVSVVVGALVVVEAVVVGMSANGGTGLSSGSKYREGGGGSYDDEGADVVAAVVVGMSANGGTGLPSGSK